MKINDLHNDIITSESFEYSQKFFNQNYEFVNTILLAIWTTHTKYNSYLSIAELINQYMNSFDKMNLLFGIEDISAIEEKNYDDIVKLGILYASLTWNYDNCLGGGAYGESRLLHKGKKLLGILEKANILLDTAHLNEKTFFDCIDNFSGKIINSHTCMNEIFEHKRNIKSNQIEAIIERKGIIGISLVGDFLGIQKTPPIDKLIEHIDFYVQKYGDNNLAFGTDFYGTKNLPEGLSNYQSMHILVEKLLKIGYNKKAIEKIFWKNFDDFLRLVNGTRFI